jgi:hypothetical protein
LVNHFQGRVSCRLGQAAGAGTPFLDPPANTMQNPDWKPVCSIPGTAVNRTDRNSPDNINVEVKPQLKQRQTDKAVYCSCRCDGPDKNARYCECPDGFECSHLVDSLQITTGSGQLAGSYCIRAGSKYDANASLVDSCADDPKACGCDPGLSADKYPSECGAHP